MWRATWKNWLKNIRAQTIRHEGTHQLLFKYGIHSSHHVEHEWLVEGLATYCEMPRVGDIDRIRLGRVIEKQEDYALIPLEELVNARQTGGFMALGTVEEIDPGL